MKRLAFILNPISGTGHKEAIIQYIKETFGNDSNYYIEFYTTKFPGDAFLAAKSFVEKKFDIVVAIGGDGTVNQVAKGLINSNVKLAIIPVGSGNGLARHLKIPLSYHKAVDIIKEETCQMIDAGQINDEIFFCTAGLGFEAVIGDRFNTAGSRGLITYMEFCAKEYVRYRAEKYSIDILGNNYTKKAFLITFANCAQWGNNAFIAPDANISDGMIDVVVWKKSPMVAMPILTAGLFLKAINYSEFIDTYRCKEIRIIREDQGLIQFDGESRTMGKEIKVSVLHHVVNVIVSKDIDSLPQLRNFVPQIKDIVPKIKDIIRG